MKITNINKYIKVIENKNIILIYHNNILNAIINKNYNIVYTTCQNIKKSSVIDYINNIPITLDVELIIDLNLIYDTINIY